MARPIDVVVFPSPKGVGLIAVTRTYRPFWTAAGRFSTCRETFALSRP